jgi:hypothetical protein
MQISPKMWPQGSLIGDPFSPLSGQEPIFSLQIEHLPSSGGKSCVERSSTETGTSKEAMARCLGFDPSFMPQNRSTACENFLTTNNLLVFSAEC